LGSERPPPQRESVQSNAALSLSKRRLLCGRVVQDCWTLAEVAAAAEVGKLGGLGLEPARRYERARPGELLHIDVKKLGRIERGAGKRVTGIKRNPRRTRVDRDGVERKIIGWNTCTSRSTTAPAWPAPKCSQTRRRPPRSHSCVAPSRSTPATASQPNGY